MIGIGRLITIAWLAALSGCSRDDAAEINFVDRTGGEISRLVLYAANKPDEQLEVNISSGRSTIHYAVEREDELRIQYYRKGEKIDESVGYITSGMSVSCSKLFDRDLNRPAICSYH